MFLDKKIVQQLCREYAVTPAKMKGQNFLVDSTVLSRIIQEAELSSQDSVLEIGPGWGALTLALAEKVKKLVTVEIDSRLASSLQKLLFSYPHVEVIHQDILKISNEKIADFFIDREYNIVSNLPYSITSLVLRKFLDTDPKPKEMTLLMQKEVAERICGRAGQMSLLALSVQLYAKPRIVMPVSKKSFYPEPEVDSALVRIEEIASCRDVEARLGISTKKFFQIARMGFSSKRKMLGNTLAAGWQMEKDETKRRLVEADIDPKARPQQLSLEDWVRLARLVG